MQNQNTRVGKVHKIVRVGVMDIDDAVTPNAESHPKSQAENQLMVRL